MTTDATTFEKWCALHNVASIPAVPALIAKFVADIAPLGIEQIWPIVQEISRAHYVVGLADPTLGGPVSAALNGIAKIEPPRSWPKAMKERFLTLPYDLQTFIDGHELKRDREIRRAHNEAATARQKLAEIQEPAEATNGNHSHGTA